VTVRILLCESWCVNGLDGGAASEATVELRLRDLTSLPVLLFVRKPLLVSECDRLRFWNKVELCESVSLVDWGEGEDDSFSSAILAVCMSSSSSVHACRPATLDRGLGMGAVTSRRAVAPEVKAGKISGRWLPSSSLVLAPAVSSPSASPSSPSPEDEESESSTPSPT